MIKRTLNRFFDRVEGPKNYQRCTDYLALMIVVGLLSWVLGLRGPGNLWWILVTVGSAVIVIHFKWVVGSFFVVLIWLWMAFDIGICEGAEALFGRRGRRAADRLMDGINHNVWGWVIGFAIEVSLVPHRLRERRNKEVMPANHA